MELKKASIVKVENYSWDEVNKGLDEVLELLGFNTTNPFESFIRPGMRVFIKPNWVASRWRESCDHKGDIYSVITHPNLIEAVCDRVALALDGKGEIIVGDNPSIDADFNELLELTKIKKIEKKYAVKCTVIDMRPLFCDNLENYGNKEAMKKQSGDPLGEVEVNLRDKSLLYNVDSSLFRGVFDDRTDTVKSHTGDQQLYTFGRSLYEADVYISIPKLKTHQKVGVTLNLKGLVGSVTQKNQLVHWRVGTPETGGDEYASRAEYEASKKSSVTHRGAWPGNDTIWRMVVDLYQCMLERERKYFTIIDGIVGGEGQGPFCPNTKESKVILASDDLLIGDIVATRLMGFNPQKIKYINYFMELMGIQFDDIEIISNIFESNNFFIKKDRYLDFSIPEQWEGIKVTN